MIDHSQLPKLEPAPASPGVTSDEILLMMVQFQLHISLNRLFLPGHLPQVLCLLMYRRPLRSFQLPQALPATLTADASAYDRRGDDVPVYLCHRLLHNKTRLCAVES